MKVITKIILSLATVAIIIGLTNTFKLSNKERITLEEKSVMRNGSAVGGCPGIGNNTSGNHTVPGAAKSPGTNVFTSNKKNSTDAAGLVGNLSYSISRPPYDVERCDQVLLLKGKRLNLTDYCIKTEGFMTLSIYMANLFETELSDKLIESIPLDQVTSIPSQLTGTTTCLQISGKTKSFGFCYETVDILHQVIKAYEYFHKCRQGKPDLPFLNLLLEACDINKIDFSETGPFGKQGPIYKKMIDEHKKQNGDKVDPEMKYDPKKINPYYSTLKAPGS